MHICYRCMCWTGPKSKEFSEPTGEKPPFWRFWYNCQLLIFLCHKPRKNHLVMELWVRLNYWLQKQVFKDHSTTKDHLTTPKSMLQFFKENISAITSIFIPYGKIALVCDKIEEIPADAKKHSWNAELPSLKTSNQRFAWHTEFQSKSNLLQHSNFKHYGRWSSQNKNLIWLYCLCLWYTTLGWECYENWQTK